MSDEDARLVVDASVMSAAGDLGLNASRDTLVAIEEEKHRMVASDQLLDEWDRNQSNFASRWRYLMESRGRIDHLGDVSDAKLQAELLASLGNQNNAWPVIKKDAHLVEAALQSGLRVISLDRQIRKHLRKASTVVRRIAPILWANPDIADEGVVA